MKSQYLNNPAAVCPHIVSDGTSQGESLVEAVRLIVPSWSSATADSVEIQPLTGGITNVLFKLTRQDDVVSPPLIVRLFGHGTSLFVDRHKENVVFSELSRLDIGSPTFYGLFENGRVEGFLEARAVTPSEMHDARVYPRIATAVARLHSLGPRIRDLDWEPALLPKLRTFFGLALRVAFPESEPAKQEQLAGLRLEEFRAQMEQLAAQLQADKAEAERVLALGRAQLALPPPPEEGALGPGALLQNADTAEAAAAVLAFDKVLCHNDLLSGNILLALSVLPLPEVPGTEGVTLIDLEYAGCNPRGFDLANHFCEFAGFGFDLANQFPDSQKRQAYLHCYLDAAAAAAAAAAAPSGSSSEPAEPVSAVLAAWASLRLRNDSPAAAAHCTHFASALDCAVCRFLPASHLFWAAWSVVQASLSAIDFDFLAYARKRFDGYLLHRNVAGLA